jgi:hypothetical protein
MYYIVQKIKVTNKKVFMFKTNYGHLQVLHTMHCYLTAATGGLGLLVSSEIPEDYLLSISKMSNVLLKQRNYNTRVHVNVTLYQC